MTAYGPYHGTVDRVVDGDTVYVRLDVGFDLTVYARVRLTGINAPELANPDGSGYRARDFARELLPEGASVQVVSHGWDKYGGRVDGEIITPDGTGFAHAMVDSGHAVPWDGKGQRP